MTSNYMPDVVVEIAFDSGYTTPDASRTWTDVSEWVELAQGGGITFGRQDELSTADANRLTLTLDNSDGRFTAGRAASPYYPNVKIGRPIRVTATPPGGAASTRFVGFIDQWPVEWDGTDAYAKATVTATSRLARLGVGRKMRSTVEEAIQVHAPAYYYTLGDAAESTSAAGSSGNGESPLVIATSHAATPGPAVPVFGNGTGLGTDGLTACQFPADSYPLENAAVPQAASWMCVFNIASSGSVVYLLRAFGPASSWALSLETSSGGTLLAKNSAGATLITGPNVADGSTHVLMATITGPTDDLATVYLDGVSVGAATLVTPTEPDRLVVGGVAGTPGVTMSHVAGFAATLTALQAADLADSLLTAGEGERTDERIERILGWAGVAASEVSAQTGDETMTYQQTSGQSVVDALRECESTEGGVLFDGADGRVTFHNRSHRYQAPIAVTLDMAEQQVEADYAPKLDRSTLTNDVTIDNPTTGETARSVDQASADEYGTATSSAKSVADSYDPLQQKASWLVASYAEPRPRVPSLTVDVLAQVGGTPSPDDLLALTVGSRIKVTNQPVQADATEADYFVEGYTESIGPESYFITFNLSPAHPPLSVFVLEDATRGELDSTYVLAL